jgi:TatA/E family protein of Tat protein translocase
LASLGVVGIESPVHLLFIAVVALVVLGPKRLPGLARALGQGIREFRQSLDIGASGETPPPAASETSAPQASSATPSPAPPQHAADSTPTPAPAPHAADTTPAPPPSTSADVAPAPPQQT